MNCYVKKQAARGLPLPRNRRSPRNHAHVCVATLFIIEWLLVFRVRRCVFAQNSGISKNFVLNNVSVCNTHIFILLYYLCRLQFFCQKTIHIARRLKENICRDMVSVTLRCKYSNNSSISQTIIGHQTNFTEPSVNFLQQPWSNLTEALEHCYRIAGALLRGCWRKLPTVVCKN